MALALNNPWTNNLWNKYTKFIFFLLHFIYIHSKLFTQPLNFTTSYHDTNKFDNQLLQNQDLCTLSFAFMHALLSALDGVMVNKLD